MKDCDGFSKFYTILAKFARLILHWAFAKGTLNV